ncbi:MAG: hypothetical protein SVR81_09790 [Chloroflexota bacterium]|nr:hypothetical protein [Chloroflexota bacterium]
MVSGKKTDPGLDLLTAWELAAINVLLAAEPQGDFDVNAVQANMLTFVKTLDAGKLTPALEDQGFLQKTEALLLAMLKGEQIDVINPEVYAARQAVFAAAQVTYNQAVARGVWQLHPEIQNAMSAGE